MSNKFQSNISNWYRRLSGKLLDTVATPHLLGDIPKGLQSLPAKLEPLVITPQTESGESTPPAVIGHERAICYVFFEHSMSNALLVDGEARRQNLPAPLNPMVSHRLNEETAILYIKNTDEGNPFRTPTDVQPPRLLRLMDAVAQFPDLDVELVPITILWGRAPDKEDSLFKLLFADSWATPSLLKQSANIIVHGRQAFVQFHDPLPLRSLVADIRKQGPSDANEIAKRIMQQLRDYLTRQREIVLGPDLSDRRNMVDDLMSTQSIQEAIQREMTRSNKTSIEVHHEAHGYLDEIASDYSYSAVRFLERSLTWLWTQLYDGVEVHHFQSVRNIADEYELIYTPSHRSHIDYLLLSYVIYKRGMMIPYIAAGDNLNIPGVGPLLRRGGAFFIRRTFKGNPLYVSVFKEYLHSILTRNNPIEYFIEGGRSRTGRLLPPKTGMLAMTIHSHMRGAGKPIAFIPTYIGYERLMEGATYVGEMSGKPKESESVWGLLQAARKIERIFGKVHVSFGEPVFLDQVLKAHNADNIQLLSNDDPMPREAKLAVDTVAENIMQNINRAAVLNPVSLLSVVLLATPKHALDEEVCIKQLDTYRSLAEAVPYDERIEITTFSGRDIIAYGLKLKLIKRVKHLLGDMIAIEDGQGVLLTYFRNNILHLFILPSLIASLVQHNGRISREEIGSVIQTLYPFLQAELFLKWRKEMLDEVIDQQLAALIAAELVLDDGSNTVYSPPPNSEAYNQLGVLAAPVQQSLERYFMTLTLLSQQGSGRITAKQVEDLSHLLGQRLSVLYEFNSPEFFDKALFRSFVAALSELKYVTIDDQGLIHFDHRLINMAEDSRLVLNADTLNALQHMTNVSEEEIQSAIAALAKKKERKPKAK
ncbi:glycerol-3-phosphate 1-O-acyltransferase PlsB [Aquirhabdus parva]|uniref:Glycerol-3-phosphate acyltransferase n=1 Tax=Aquirhabdus parva TaxID=2283318 RepID=A0A345P3M1_9GAMM|nr:glycerol-3-phosphate 1-O-acyltransferase PlsB [Aquirhabdus parva]AXI01880.1 glycerol-3-phosphate 1-O-acyltransferase PlsB [Aquirhabdus parva]